MAELTPYDTGARLEPRTWVEDVGGSWVTGSERLRDAFPDDFGRVDFDDDEGATIATIYVERGPGSTPSYRVHVEAHADAVTVTPATVVDVLALDRCLAAWEAFDGDVDGFLSAWVSYLTGADNPCPDDPSGAGLHYVTDGSCNYCGSKNRT
ncbi:MAG: hypothetical protein QM598_05600 [Protaetiibacter sp.]